MVSAKISLRRMLKKFSIDADLVNKGKRQILSIFSVLVTKLTKEVIFEKEKEKGKQEDVEGEEGGGVERKKKRNISGRGERHDRNQRESLNPFGEYSK